MIQRDDTNARLVVFQMKFAVTGFVTGVEFIGKVFIDLVANLCRKFGNPTVKQPPKIPTC